MEPKMDEDILMCICTKVEGRTAQECACGAGTENADKPDKLCTVRKVELIEYKGPFMSNATTRLKAKYEKNNLGRFKTEVVPRRDSTERDGVRDWVITTDTHTGDVDEIPLDEYNKKA